MYVCLFVHRHRHRHNTHTYTHTHTTLPCHTGVTRHLRSADKERMPVSFNLRDTASRSLSLLQIFRTMLSMPPGPPSLQSSLSSPGRNSQRSVPSFIHIVRLNGRLFSISTRCTLAGSGLEKYAPNAPNAVGCRGHFQSWQKFSNVSAIVHSYSIVNSYS